MLTDKTCIACLRKTSEPESCVICEDVKIVVDCDVDLFEHDDPHFFNNMKFLEVA